MKEYYNLKQNINLRFNCSFQKNSISIFLMFILILSNTIKVHAQDVLPFPPVPSASVANETLAESTHKRRAQPDHLPKDAPNIIIILMDDLGFGTPSTFGGGVNTPTLTKVFKEGIAYNEFHTTSICSPSRAALLTGRNHTHVGNGTIAERAVDWDGYTGIIPKEAATVAEVLKNYGYSTSAFGKWHNTPANQTTVAGPFDYWPVNYGFQHFYGFLAGETSQYEPRLINDFTPVEPPKDEKYHLTTDLADHAIEWMNQHKSYAADKPFLLYFAPGAGHAPHHIFKEWADKYKGKFDDGWDAYREKVFKRQKELGWIPKSAMLTARDKTMASWESIPKSERAFQIRMMEVFAGYVEHADHEVGRVLDALEANGQKDNTIVFFIWGDNGSSAEGQNGSISELLAQNGVSNTIQQQLEALDKLGGLDAIGGPLLENNYHAAWAWAGNTPFKHTKLVASHFGGTQNAMVIRWPKKIKPDSTPRSQFHHINDVVPTIYDILNIKAPKEVNGFDQMPLDGVSFKYTFNDAKAKEVSKVQFFDNNGSRGVYKDGWYACTFGPLYPWIPAQKGLAEWDSTKDVWELYNIKEDYTQYYDLASKNPQKLKELQEVFNEEAKKNKDYPIGAGIWLRIHPEDVIKAPYTSWTFDETTKRMPEFSAPGLGKKSNKVIADVEVKENASGVLYALGGSGGGVTLFMDKGKLVYEYNMLIIERYNVESSAKIPAGKHKIEVLTTIAKPGAPAEIVILVDGKEYAKGEVKRTVPVAFTASETFDVGEDLGGPVSIRYYKKAPFKFEGKINNVKVDLL
ncbi:arylsulfatase [Flavobacterium johnsoniae]|uniref:arylsulfatase n=1 Tax=Flavobacterium johnsoniae TaxID=986 RepID=UPI0025B13712|nr:arylsulfatase [Flavobacterium johnsoniae]WJS93300.1 arylsulfatase [Flavobacterium johnsoniae]